MQIILVWYFPTQTVDSEVWELSGVTYTLFLGRYVAAELYFITEMSKQNYLHGSISLGVSGDIYLAFGDLGEMTLYKHLNLTLCFPTFDQS